MDQQPAPVNVPQEVVAQARPLGGTLDDAGDIRHDEGHALVHIDDPQVGEEGGEVVVGDLGPGVGGDGEQGGFAHIGEAHQAHVRQELELQNHVPLLALDAGLGKPGHLPGGGGVVGIAPASPAPLGQNEILPGGHIHNDLVRFRVSYHGAPGDFDDQGLSPLAAHVPALAVLARLGGILALIAEIQQGGQIVVDPQDHAAPMAPVSPIGAAGGHIFLPVEGHGTVAALAAQDCNPNFIYKHINLQGLKKGLPRNKAAVLQFTGLSYCSA